MVAKSGDWCSCFDQLYVVLILAIVVILVLVFLLVFILVVKLGVTVKFRVRGIVKVDPDMAVKPSMRT